MKKILLILLCLPMMGFGQDNCGEKPIYKGNKFGNNYKQSKTYKTYAKNLSIWEECIRKKNVVVDGLDLSSEVSIREYFDKNGAEHIEGIWETAGAGNNYRLVIKKDDYYT